MIALALLFITIICLLAVIVNMLRQYFKAYQNAHVSNTPHTELAQNKTGKTTQAKTNNEVNSLLKQRLINMEKHIGLTDPKEEPFIHESEFLKALKSMLHSNLKLLAENSEDPKSK